MPGHLEKSQKWYAKEARKTFSNPLFARPRITLCLVLGLLRSGTTSQGVQSLPFIGTVKSLLDVRMHFCEIVVGWLLRCDASYRSCYCFFTLGHGACLPIFVVYDINYH